MMLMSKNTVKKVQYLFKDPFTLKRSISQAVVHRYSKNNCFEKLH